MRPEIPFIGIVLVMFVAACSSSSAHTGNNTPNPDANITPMNIPAIAKPLQCAQGGSSERAGTFVQSDGAHFTYDHKPLQLNGYTFYPGGAGGTAAWRSTQFTQYIDSMIALGAQAGQNLIRPTDFWDKSDTAQQVEDPTIWHNLDYTVCAARAHGMFVVMDVSAYKWLLMSHGQDPTNANLWQTFLVAVADHYRNEPSIAFYSISGEPDPPKTAEATKQLVSFYQTLTDTLYAADPNHLITAGGFNHMEEETPQTPWWHQIYALPHNDIAGFKTYSQHDLSLMPAIGHYAQSIHKIAFDDEFGMPQGQGDADFTGGAPYNQITTGRAQFFDNVYSTGQGLGVGGFVFWNMGCQVQDSSFEVSPLTPAVWQAIINHAAVSPTGNADICQQASGL